MKIELMLGAIAGAVCGNMLGLCVYLVYEYARDWYASRVPVKRSSYWYGLLPGAKNDYGRKAN